MTQKCILANQNQVINIIVASKGFSIQILQALR